MAHDHSNELLNETRIFASLACLRLEHLKYTSCRENIWFYVFSMAIRAMQSISSKIWTWVAVSISNNNINYPTSASINNYKYYLTLLEFDIFKSNVLCYLTMFSVIWRWLMIIRASTLCSMMIMVLHFSFSAEPYSEFDEHFSQWKITNNQLSCIYCILMYMFMQDTYWRNE